MHCTCIVYPEVGLQRKYIYIYTLEFDLYRLYRLLYVTYGDYIDKRVCSAVWIVDFECTMKKGDVGVKKTVFSTSLS